MNTYVSKLYEYAKTDSTFKEQFLKASSKNKIPNIFTDQITKHIFVSVYAGYCIGTGKHQHIIDEMKNYES